MPQGKLEVLLVSAKGLDGADFLCNFLFSLPTFYTSMILFCFTSELEMNNAKLSSRFQMLFWQMWILMLFLLAALKSIKATLLQEMDRTRNGMRISFSQSQALLLSSISNYLTRTHSLQMISLGKLSEYTKASFILNEFFSPSILLLRDLVCSILPHFSSLMYGQENCFLCLFRIPLEPVLAEGSLPVTAYNIVKDGEYCGEVKLSLTFRAEESYDRDLPDEALGGWKDSDASY
ncbi:hypothetical protein V2J09_001507 [Rumex salicifolius]